MQRLFVDDRKDDYKIINYGVYERKLITTLRKLMNIIYIRITDKRSFIIILYDKMFSENL